MANLIKSLPFVGKKYRVMLKKAKITTTGEILERGICRTSRENLANELGISERLISKWVNLADLLRVKGIGKRYLKLLDKIGIGNLNKLSKQGPDNILQKIDSLDQEDLKKIKRKPSLKTIRRWIEESRKTRKIVQNLSDDLDILEVDSKLRIFSLHEIILNLIRSREWESLMNVGLRIKSGSVFNILNLKFELEEQKEKAREDEKLNIRWAHIEKNVLKQLKNEKIRKRVLEQIRDKEMRLRFMKLVEDKLKNQEWSKKRQIYGPVALFDFEEKLKDDLFLYFSSNFTILIAKLHLALEEKKPSEIVGKETYTKLKPKKLDMNKLLVEEIGENLRKIKIYISMLPRRIRIIEMEKCSVRLCNLIVKLKKLSLENRNLKINKLITEAYELYQTVLLNCLFWLYSLISDKRPVKKRWKKDLKKLGINFPENRDILRKDDFDYLLIKKIYGGYKVGGKL